MSDSGRDFRCVIRSISKGRALSLRVRRAGQASRGSVFRYIGSRELDFRLLLEGRVDGGYIDGE